METSEAIASLTKTVEILETTSNETLLDSAEQLMLAFRLLKEKELTRQQEWQIKQLEGRVMARAAQLRAQSK